MHPSQKFGSVPDPRVAGGSAKGNQDKEEEGGRGMYIPDGAQFSTWPPGHRGLEKGSEDGGSPPEGKGTRFRDFETFVQTLFLMPW